MAPITGKTLPAPMSGFKAQKQNHLSSCYHGSAPPARRSCSSRRPASSRPPPCTGRCRTSASAAHTRRSGLGQPRAPGGSTWPGTSTWSYAFRASGQSETAKGSLTPQSACAPT
eukprot:697078-Rhodomonas_salina.1